MKTNITVLLLFLLSNLFAQEEQNYPTLKAQQYAETALAAHAEGNYQEAEKHAKLTLRELRGAEQKNTALYTSWQENRAVILLELGDVSEAVKLYQDNAENVIKYFGELSGEYIANRTGIARGIRSDMESYADAVVYRLEALRVVEQIVEEKDPVLCHYLNLAAEDLRYAGEHEQAIAAYKRLILLIEKYQGKNAPEYGYTLLKLGGTYADRLKWEEALPKLKEGLKLYEPFFSNPIERYIADKNLFNAYFQTGDIENAKKYLRSMPSSEEFASKLPISILGNFYSEIADFHELTGEPDSASYYLKKALTKNKEVYGENSTQYHFSIYRIALFDRMSANFSEAERGYKIVLDWLEQNPEQRSISKFYPEIGLLYCYTDMGKYEEASAMYPQAREVSEKIYGKYSFSLSEVYMHAAYAFRGKGDNQRSKEAFALWTDTYQQYLNRIFRYFSEDRQQKLLQTQANVSSQISSFAFDETDSLYVNTGFMIARHYKNLLFDGLSERQAIARQENSATADLWARRTAVGKSLADLYMQAGGTESEDFAVLREAYTDLNDQIALTAADLMVDNRSENSFSINTPEKGTAILETVRFRYYDGLVESTDSVFYVAYLLRHDRQPERIFLFEESELGKISATRRLYNPKAAEDKVTWRKMLADKLLPYLTDINTLYYSPTGLLHRINFGAVPIDDERTFADRFALHLLPSTLRAGQAAKIKLAEKDALIFGGIDYDTSAELSIAEPKTDPPSNQRKEVNPNGSAWEYLPWTLQEVEDIQTTLSKNDFRTRLLTGKQATEEAFKKIGTETASPRILHLATHGYFFPYPEEEKKTEGIRAVHNSLIRSGLVLSGANPAWTGASSPTKQEDGILTAYEIAQMNLSNTELVVLSACDTGLGDINGNEGVYGLQRAFKTAGVKYVLMSLWSVNDKKTYEFMTRFYDLYQNEGKSIPEAYQLTQNELRVKYALPFNPRGWAGFVLVE